MPLPLAGLFTGFITVIRTIIFDPRSIALSVGGAVAYFLQQNAVRLVVLTIGVGLVYAAQGYIMGYFGQLIPQLQQCLSLASVDDGITIVISAYIWRLTHFTQGFGVKHN